MQIYFSTAKFIKATILQFFNLWEQIILFTGKSNPFTLVEI